MKRAVAAGILLLLLTGCGAAETAQVEDVRAAVTVSGTLTATQTEQSARPLTQEEVLAAYDRAVAAYTWFDLTPLNSAGESQTVNGRVYRKVEKAGLETMEELRGYLRTIFSEELTERLLATGGETPLYIEIDGQLWAAVNGGRRRDASKGAVTLQVSQKSETEYEVNVTTDLLEDGEVSGVQCCGFPYQWVDDRWVFTEFELVY